MHGDIFRNIENTSQEDKAFVLQNDYALLVNLNGTVYAKQGSMVAYKGNIDFAYKGSGAMRFLKRVATGEDMPLMKVTGQGDVYLANQGHQVHIVDLAGDKISITSRNVLAFTDGIDWDIGVIKAGVMGFAAGGLFNVTLNGQGSVALTSIGTPIVIPVDENGVFVDVNSVLAWSSDLKVSIKSSFKGQQLIGRGSGESFQMAFQGSGFVVVQPGEGLMYSVSA